MKIAIIGASGAVGRAVVRQLLTTTTYELVLFSHHAEEMQFDRLDEKRLQHEDGDILQYDDIVRALHGCTMAIYLVHLMGNARIGSKFSSAEAQAATNFAKAARKQTITRVVYVGGMGKSDNLTQHLQSRQATGAIIRSKLPLLIEFKVPMIIGPASAGYEVLRSLVHRLPLFIVPTWSRALAQPITVTDVARYVAAAIDLQVVKHTTIEIGGPEQLTYQQIAQRYAASIGKRLRVVVLPLIPKSLVAFVLRRFKRHKSAGVVADMIASAAHPMIVETDDARQLFPQIKPEPIEAGFSYSQAKPSLSRSRS